MERKSRPEFDGVGDVSARPPTSNARRSLAEAHRRLDELEPVVRAQSPMLEQLLVAMGRAPDALRGDAGAGVLGMLHTIHDERTQDARARERWRRRAALVVTALGVVATALTIADKAGLFR